MITDTPHNGDRITRSGIPTDEFHALLEAIQVAINFNEVASGSGSPEGVVTAEPRKMYMDTAGTAGNILYIKKTGTGNTGWILV